MKREELLALGYPRSVLAAALAAAAAAAASGWTRDQIRAEFTTLISEPEHYRSDPLFAALALQLSAPAVIESTPRTEPISFAIWGKESIDPAAITQMDNACRLPIAVAGALMPDAHVGYGLPIGGVLATKDAVIPYAVGVDIACRVMLTVLDIDPRELDAQREALSGCIERNTRFGMGASFEPPREHPVLDDRAWAHTPLLRALQSTARHQLGTSGSGNHFVEFGTIEALPDEGSAITELASGRSYTALVSHSGSRGVGARIAEHYSVLARTLHPTLPGELAHLAWLPMDGVGAEYWEAMELMGAYASANHHLIHQTIIEQLGATPLLQVENHHNFAWKERWQGEQLIVHRKGATPAGAGVRGFIPGSMIDPGYLVVGCGVEASLNSAAHGAGRRLSRAAAKKAISTEQLARMVEDHGVTLLSGGRDEAPIAYKPIEAVMRAQSDLVRPLARFTPVIVKMAAGTERAED